VQYEFSCDIRLTNERFLLTVEKRGPKHVTLLALTETFSGNTG
jgi:hypothetical protein